MKQKGKTSPLKVKSKSFLRWGFDRLGSVLFLLKKFPKRVFLLVLGGIVLISLALIFRNYLGKTLFHALVVIGDGYNALNGYLKIKNTDSFISSTFTGLGTASIGALAIIFSISLFAVQQGYATYAQRAVRIFLKDPVSTGIYIGTSILIFAFYILAFLDQTEQFKDNLGGLLLFGGFGVFLLLILIFLHYRRVTQIISPVYVIEYFGEAARSKLKRKLSGCEIEQPGEFTTEEKNRLFYLSSITKELKNDIEEICNVIKKYQQRKEYSIIQAGLDQLLLISYAYIDHKQGLFFPGHSELWLLPGVSQMAHDPILGDIDGVLEKLRDISNIATSEKDIETVRRILFCYEGIANKTLDIKYRGEHVTENHNFTLVVGYMQGVAKESGVVIPDAAMQASYCIDRLIPNVFTKDKQSIYMNASALMGVADNIALLGAANINARYLVKDSTRVLLKIIWHYVFTDLYFESYMSMSMDKLKQIVFIYLRFIGGAGTDMDFTIGNVFGELENYSIPNLIRALGVKIQQTQDLDKRREFLEILKDLNDYLWRFYMEILEEVGKRESELIWRISLDLRSIIIILVVIAKTEGIDETHKNEIINSIGWYFSNYWRMYHFHSKITKGYRYSIQKDIFEIGLEFHKAGYSDLQKEVISIFLSIAEDFREKEVAEPNFGFTVPRIILSALKFSIFSKKTDDFLEILGKRIDQGKLAIQPFQWKIFVDEYWSMGQGDDRMIIDADAYIESQITKKEVDDFFPSLAKFMFSKGIYPKEDKEKKDLQ